MYFEEIKLEPAVQKTLPPPMPPLQQELIRMTDPDRFMNPYDADIVQRAFELNQIARVINMSRPFDVMILIGQAISDLECEYPAELVYEYLLSIYKPTIHIENFQKYNSLCQRFYDMRDDILAITRIVQEEENQKLLEKSR